MGKSSKPTPEVMRAIYKIDLASFIEFTFRTLYPNRVYQPNWHIDVIADKLTQCYNRNIKRLIINMPPRSLKSTCASVAFPAWVLANNPSEQIMCVSYGDELVKEFGNLTRKVMTSPRYMALFPEARLSTQNPSTTQLNTLLGGYRRGVSTNGAITGRGADIVVMDDVLKASDAATKERERTNQWYDDNIYQRLNVKNDGVIILVMQRLHEYDLTAHLMEASDEWELLELRAIAEEDEAYQIEKYGRRVTHVRKKGDALHPTMESVEQLLNLKKRNGGYTFAAQYQQAPAADKEALIRAEWFKRFSLDQIHQNRMVNDTRYLQRMGFTTVIQSWDTACTANERSDYSVCVTLGVKDKQFYVLDVFRDKLSFKELNDAVHAQRGLFFPDKIIVEQAPASEHLIESLRDSYLPIKRHKPVGDKHTRLSSVSGYAESGQIYLPENARWLDDFLMEITRFPNVRNDDQVDAFTQAMAIALESTRQSMWVF